MDGAFPLRHMRHDVAGRCLVRHKVQVRDRPFIERDRDGLWNHRRSYADVTIWRDIQSVTVSPLLMSGCTSPSIMNVGDT